MKNKWFALSAGLLILGVVLFYLLPAQHKSGPALSVINVGVLPDESPEQLRARFDPLLKYLSAETGLEFRLLDIPDYDDLVEQFVEKRVHLAYFGGYTFVRTSMLCTTVPLVMREIDTRFTSYFLAPGDSTARRLEDFRDKVFSFGNRLSTSGHLMPRHFMMHSRDIVPEEFFAEVRFSGAHDRTAYMVRDGKADLGVANAEIVQTMLKDGRLSDGDLRIIWETPPYANYVWAVRESVPQEMQTRIRDAFLALDVNDAADRSILQGLGARVFLPAGLEDFAALQQLVESMQSEMRDIP